MTFGMYEMKPCVACGGDRPHNNKGNCMACRERERAAGQGWRAYRQARAFQRVKRQRRAVRGVKVTKRQRAADALPIAQAVVYRRAKGLCEVCGRSAPKGTGQAHHRLPRGSGGTSRPEVNAASNLLWLCPDSHAQIESHRTDAYTLGRLVFRSGDPAATPVLLRYGWVLLEDDGTITPCSPPPTAEVS